MTNRLFVYGTLRKGFWNHYRLSGSKFLGTEVLELQNHAMLSHGEIPILAESAVIQALDACCSAINTVKVVGEVYEVSHKVMDHIDDLEGYPTWYNRKLVRTSYGDAWVYYHEAKKQIQSRRA